MRHSVDYVVFIVLNNPIPSVGIWLLAVSLFLVCHVKTKMTAALDDEAVDTVHPFPHPTDWELSAHYLALRSKYGWSPWPVYLMWPCQVSAVLLLLVGLLR